jgi:acetyltransferase-like isoleucine patch superfamily enzyme
VTKQLKTINLFKALVWKFIHKVSSYTGLSKSIKGKNNKIYVKNVYFKNSRIIVRGNNNVISLDEKTKLVNQLIIIYGDNNNIEIGSNCFLKGKKIHIEGDGCLVRVGNKTTIEYAEIAGTEEKSKIVIGKDCMLADDIDVRNGDSHSLVDKKTGKRINFAKDILIGDHVWIASHATILKGVIIGNESVVASGAVVTSSIPNNSIYAGIPAKMIKNGITWERERIKK